MMTRKLSHAVFLVFSASVVLSVSVSAEGEDAAAALGNWPAFRGFGNGLANGRSLPVRWSEEEGVSWKVELEGYGQSSPVVWEDNVYVTSTGGEKKEALFVEAFGKETGERRWLKTLEASQTVAEVSEMISQGAPTPVVDADGVYVFFESGDLVKFDHAGEKRWSRSLTEEFGEYQGGHGIGSSLADAGDSVIVLADHDGPSYLIRIRKESGETVWKKDREARVSWTSPILHEIDGDPQLIVSSNGVIEGLRLDDGERLWWLEGVEGNTVASPAVGGDYLVTGASAPGNSFIIALGEEGDLADSDKVRTAGGVTSSFASPLVHRGRAYFVNRAGSLQATRIKDGKMMWEERLDDGTWASPISADGKLYFFSKNGVTTILDGNAKEFVVLEKNRVPVEEGDRVYGVAAGEGRLFFRTGRGLMAVGAELKE